MALKKKQKKLIIGLGCLLAVVIAGGVAATILLNHEDSNGSKTGWSDVKKDDTLPQLESENFTFAENTLIKIPDAESLSTFTVNREVNSRDDIGQKLPEIAQIIFGDMLSDTQPVIQELTSGGFEGVLEKADGSEHYKVRFYTDNQFIAYKSSTVANTTGAIADISRLENGEALSDKAYKTGSGQYTMQQALDLCEGMIDKLSPYLDDLEYKPSRVVVFEREDGQGYAFRVEFSAYKDGIPFHDSSVTGKLLEADGNISLSSHCVYMLITEPDVVGAVNKCSGATLTDEKKIENGLITLSDATELLADYYAPLYKHTIDEVSVEYVITNKLKKLTLDDGVVEGIEVTVIDSSTVEPYWCFKLEDTPEFNYDVAYCREEQKLFVNMLTGDIYTYHNS